MAVYGILCLVTKGPCQGQGEFSDAHFGISLEFLDADFGDGGGTSQVGRHKAQDQHAGFRNGL